MALRCASVGACANAGAASPNMIVVIDAKSVTLRLDVLNI
jgi:hypothetical protein